MHQINNDLASRVDNTTKTDEKGRSKKSHMGRRRILMFMDSNRRHLRADLLWDNLTIVPSGNTPELCQLLPKHEFNK